MEIKINYPIAFKDHIKAESDREAHPVRFLKLRHKADNKNGTFWLEVTSNNPFEALALFFAAVGMEGAREIYKSPILKADLSHE